MYSSAALGAIAFRAPWRVPALEVIGEHELYVWHVDGVAGRVKFEDGFFRGVFAHLKDPPWFEEVDVVCGAVAWPGELDIVPDAMHDELAANGEWILN